MKVTQCAGRVSCTCIQYDVFYSIYSCSCTCNYTHFNCKPRCNPWLWLFNIHVYMCRGCTCTCTNCTLPGWRCVYRELIHVGLCTPYTCTFVVWTWPNSLKHKAILSMCSVLLWLCLICVFCLFSLHTGNIRVFCRVRPLLSGEISASALDDSTETNSSRFIEHIHVHAIKWLT